MRIGNLTSRAATAAADTVTGLVGTSGYPETEHGLAAFLFSRIAQAERSKTERDRTYYLDLMGACLATVRGGKA